MIDEFGLYPRDEPFDPFSVMLFKGLQVVAFLFFLALLAISPEAKSPTFSTRAGGEQVLGLGGRKKRVGSMRWL